jgi:hypothetical protein
MFDTSKTVKMAAAGLGAALLLALSACGEPTTEDKTQGSVTPQTPATVAQASDQQQKTTQQ